MLLKKKLEKDQVSVMLQMTLVNCTVVSTNNKVVHSWKISQVGDYNAISCLEFQKSLSPNQLPACMLLPEGEGPETNNQFGVA